MLGFKMTETRALLPPPLLVPVACVGIGRWHSCVASGTLAVPHTLAHRRLCLCFQMRFLPEHKLPGQQARY